MHEKTSILIVDDDLHILEVIEARLESAGYEVVKASGAHEALQTLKTRRISLVVSDIKMPGMSGFRLLEEISAQYPALPVIFLTAFGTIPDAVKALKSGAVEYLTKPFDGQELIQKVKEILKRTSPVTGKDASVNLGYSGKNSEMTELYKLIEKVAGSDVNVLILGESGVGKEYVAQYIHRISRRKKYPFVVVDCGSTPATLLESELFGHMKGSFTNAIRDKKGLIEAAHLGTLFLDEIGNISPEMQTRLLRFLESRTIRRVGDVHEIQVDCRVIAATNAKLEDEVTQGRFRRDLYYRLRVVALTLPPLCDRKEDIPNLVQGFIESICKKQNIPPVQVSVETMEWLCNYPWHGNVRELKNSLEAGIVLCKGGVLVPDDLRLAGLPDDPEMMAVSPPKSQSESNPASYLLEENEHLAIIRALEEAGWVQKKAAKLLGISRRSIHYKIKKYGIVIRH